MRASLTLQWSLFQKQKREIHRTVQGASRAFLAYEARYRKATSRYRRRLSLDEVSDQVAAADIVYVGDYHTLKLAQLGYQSLVEAAVKTGRRVVLALEFVEGRHQAVLDAFVKGKVPEKKFLERIGHPYRGAFDIWPNFAPVLKLARAERLEVLAIDRRATGPGSLDTRDRYAAARITEASSADDRPLVLVLMGQYHVAPKHLPARVREALDVERKHLVVYQNAEGVYWQLARQGLVDGTRAVEVREGELCLVSTSPVIAQQTFLDYVNSEAGDQPLEGTSLAGRFEHLVRLLGDAVGVETKRAVKDLLIATPGDTHLLEQLQERGRFSARELQRLRQHVLTRESAYIPRARAVYLASFSLNHAAEEATHFVRHTAVGEGFASDRPRPEAFFSRCLEEALGFFGSRLVNPARRCTQLSEWQSLFASGDSEHRATAAFVLALKAVEKEGPEQSLKLIPRDDSHFHSVSHALGYLLGEALFRAHEAGRLGQAELEALFRDPFTQAAERYFALCERFLVTELSSRVRAKTKRVPMNPVASRRAA